MTSSLLSIINSSMRDLLKSIEKLKSGRGSKEEVMRLIDDIENHVDNLIQSISPERITDERFTAAITVLNEMSSKLSRLREYVLTDRLHSAIRIIPQIQGAIRHAFRVMNLLQAGTPISIILRGGPEYLREIETSPPEGIVLRSPLATQIYNILVRKGQTSVEDIASELKIDEKTRTDFNRAINDLITLGYAKVNVDKDNRILLRPAR
jgi:hypothetical protein